MTSFIPEPIAETGRILDSEADYFSTSFYDDLLYYWLLTTTLLVLVAVMLTAFCNFEALTFRKFNKS